MSAKHNSARMQQEHVLEKPEPPCCWALRAPVQLYLHWLSRWPLQLVVSRKITNECRYLQSLFLQAKSILNQKYFLLQGYKKRGPPPLFTPVPPRSSLAQVLGSVLSAGLCHWWAAEAQKPRWFWPLKLPSKKGRHCVLQQSLGVRSPQGSERQPEKEHQDSQGRAGLVHRGGQGWGAGLEQNQTD